MKLVRTKGCDHKHYWDFQEYRWCEKCGACWWWVPKTESYEWHFIKKPKKPKSP